jgi:hypothetical protein
VHEYLKNQTILLMDIDLQRHSENWKARWRGERFVCSFVLFVFLSVPHSLITLITTIYITAINIIIITVGIKEKMNSVRNQYDEKDSKVTVLISSLSFLFRFLSLSFFHSPFSIL